MTKYVITYDPTLGPGIVDGATENYVDAIIAGNKAVDVLEIDCNNHLIIDWFQVYAKEKKIPFENVIIKYGDRICTLDKDGLRMPYSVPFITPRQAALIRLNGKTPK